MKLSLGADEVPLNMRLHKADWEEEGGSWTPRNVHSDQSSLSLRELGRLLQPLRLRERLGEVIYAHPLLSRWGLLKPFRDRMGRVGVKMGFSAPRGAHSVCGRAGGEA